MKWRKKMRNGNYAHQETSLDRSPEGWNEELSLEFPLARRALVKAGVVNKDNYPIECARIGALGTRAVLNNLNPHDRLVAILGIGAFRERDLVFTLNQRGVSVAVFDFSEVACNTARQVFGQIPPFPNVRNRVHQVDVEKLFLVMSDTEAFVAAPPEYKEALRDLLLADFIYAGQFMQVLDNIGVANVMRGAGTWLRRARSLRIVLVHAFEEDNPGVEWGYTTPYPLEDLIRPATATASRPLQVFGIDEPDNIGGFYDDVYRAFCVR